MRRNLLMSMCLAVTGLCLDAHRSTAQTPCTGHAMTAQERIAKRDIRERIDASIDAEIARDADASARHLAEDFTLLRLDGTVLNRQQVLKGNEQEKRNVLMVSDRTRIRIECLVLSGREATVYTNQHYVRYLPDRKNGSPHEVITNVTHKETWVFTTRGWRVRQVEELRQGETLLDGQPYTP